MNTRLVHDATASHAQPSHSPNRVSTARATPVTDTAATTPRPRGGGGHPQHAYLDGEEIRLGAGSPLPYVGLFGSLAIAPVVLVLWLSGAMAVLDALLVAVGLFSIAIVMVIVGGVVERFFPDVPDKLAAILDTETCDERRVRADLYRPGSRVEVRRAPSCLHCSSREYAGGLCAFHYDRSQDERYEHSWDEPEF